MESIFEMSEAAIKTNLEYYKELRCKYTEQALQALGEEKRWECALKMKQTPEAALTNMLITNQE